MVLISNKVFHLYVCCVRLVSAVTANGVNISPSRPFIVIAVTVSVSGLFHNWWVSNAYLVEQNKDLKLGFQTLKMHMPKGRIQLTFSFFVIWGYFRVVYLENKMISVLWYKIWVRSWLVYFSSYVLYKVLFKTVGGRKKTVNLKKASNLVMKYVNLTKYYFIKLNIYKWNGRLILQKWSMW